MKTGTIAVLTLVLAIAGSALGDSPKPAAQIESTITRLMAAGDVPGLSIALVGGANPGSKPVWVRGFGVKSAATKEPVTPDTVFDAGSLSKPVFAYAVLKLVDQGRLELDAPLSGYLPAPYIENDDRVKRITARHVLSHTTGFPNWRPRGRPLLIHFTPGDRFSYSGEGFVYLQAVVEKLTGRPLDALMRELVFEPLGMNNSSYVWQERFGPLVSVGHDVLAIPAAAIPAAPAANEKRTAANAAASLQTTASDYARFLAAVLEGKGLKKATLRQMLAPQVRLDESCTNCLTPRTAQLSPSLSWGLGWGLQRTAEGEAFWHWGDNGDFKCYTISYPRRKQGLVIFTNSANGLAIIPEIVAGTGHPERSLQAAAGGSHPAFAWLKYESYDSPRLRLLKAVVDKGSEAAIAQYRVAGAGERLTERQMNSLGYALLRLKKIPDAIAMFGLNVEAFPNSANVYDSLGEAYLAAGQRDLAIENYRKSVALDPANTNGAEFLKKLEAEAQPRSGAAQRAAGPPAAPPPHSGKLEVIAEKDVRYGEGDERQKLDVYRPREAGGGARPKPAVIFFHGGGWRGGDKRAFTWHAADVASLGYVGFSANYRLAPQHHYPAALDDVQRAVRWVRAHAAEYGVDPRRVCAVGSSAGGHLVALAGVRDTRDNSDPQLARFDSRVTCVVDYFGPADFSRMGRREVAENGPVYQFIGKSPTVAPEAWADASPVTHVSPKSAPLLAIHGTADNTVPIAQSEQLVEKLKAAGVEAMLLRVEGAPHGFHNRLATPDAERAWKAALGFLARHLRPSGVE